MSKPAKISEHIIILKLQTPLDINSFPSGELEETTRTSSHHVDEDYPAGPGII